MSKFDRKKIAVTLAFASLFGNKTSAVNSNINTKSTNKSGFSTDQIKNSKSGAEIPKPLGTLNIRNDSSGNGIFNWVKNHKAVSIAAPLLIVGAVGLTIWGVKHKSKDSQNPDEQNPGGPKSNEQDPNKKKDNEQKPPIKGNTDPQQMPPEPRITSGSQMNDNPYEALRQLQQQQRQQLLDGYASQAVMTVGERNSRNFANAVLEFSDQNNGDRLAREYISSVLTQLEATFPFNLNGRQNFAPLLELKQQEGVGFKFFKDQRAAVHCCVYIGDFVYDFCFYGDDDSNVFMKCCRRGNNNNWPVVEQIKIENNVVSVVKQ